MSQLAIIASLIENGKNVPFDIKVEVRERGSLDMPKFKEKEPIGPHFPPPSDDEALTVMKEVPKKIKKKETKREKSLDLGLSY